MFDAEKIKLMTKLAIYDKDYFEPDSRKDQYFRHDYIYRQNMWVRFFAIIGCVILVVFYFMYKFAYQDLNIYTMDYKQELIKIISIVLVVMVAYTIIGTIIFTAEFEKTQKRMDDYFQTVDRLEQRDSELKKRN